MKKIHTYEVCFYTSGGFLKRKWVDARTKAECIKKTRDENKVIEMYSIRFIR